LQGRRHWPDEVEISVRQKNLSASLAPFLDHSRGANEGGLFRDLRSLLSHSKVQNLPISSMGFLLGFHLETEVENDMYTVHSSTTRSLVYHEPQNPKTFRIDHPRLVRNANECGHY